MWIKQKRKEQKTEIDQRKKERKENKSLPILWLTLVHTQPIQGQSTENPKRVFFLSPYMYSIVISMERI